MNYGIIDLLKLLGALVLFLYGMKLMSESLQRVASDKMRSILSAMTSNKFNGILTGFLITAIIQSSSATTVMLVSFVNAGLLSLVQSIGVIMGANIGTTVTAWIISIFGFKMNIAHYVLPIMAIALPLMFSSNKRKSNWGGVIIGFALIFIGLEFLKDSTPDLQSNPGLMQFMAGFSSWGYWSVLLYMILGTLITMVMQSSSAVMALTLVMCYNGWISFEMASAMVLGQNIGTTITANLAALIANTAAKRAARAHLIFNVIGVFLILVIFHPFLKFINWITVSTGSLSPFPTEGQTLQQTAEAIPVALSIFHSIFNGLNTLLLIWFVPSLVKLVVYLVPQKEEDEEFKLKYITTGILSTNELSILQAKKETAVYAEHTAKMLKTVRNMFEEENDKKSQKLIQKIIKQEEMSDQFEEEIANYLTHIAEETLSITSTENINLIFFIISHLEDMGDACKNITNSMNRKIDAKINIDSVIIKNLNNLYETTQKQIDIVINLMSSESVNNKLYEDSVKINNKFIKELSNIRNEHYKKLKKKEYKCKAGIIYSDFYADIEKIETRAYEINKAIYESRKNQ